MDWKKYSSAGAMLSKLWYICIIPCNHKQEWRNSLWTDKNQRYITKWKKNQQHIYRLSYTIWVKKFVYLCKYLMKI